jgi:hypothetical protein
MEKIAMFIGLVAAATIVFYGLKLVYLVIAKKL